MTTMRIILLRSSKEGSWFLSRKAKELIDYYQVSPIELFFVYDSVEKIPLFAFSLIGHRIPFIKAENVGKIQKAGCILLSLESFYKTDIYPQCYFFFLLSRRLAEKRIDFVRHLKDENIKGAYLILCRHARQEGEDLSYLLNGEMVTDVEWRNPGIVYFQKENDHWQPYWQGVPRWMVPELLVRVVDALAKHQREFLKRGFSGMAALTLKEIASTVGCAESSVSRIIGGVEAETPWGRIPLKCLFSQKVPSRSGFTSQTAVLVKVVKLIQAEDKRNPLSDEDIAKEMRREGINAARRTITKYRQKLGIASSSARKQDENNSQSAYPEGDARKSIPVLIKKIISGGQTGVERAALDVALELGIPCGGWCPKGRKAEDGKIDIKYPLKETYSRSYRSRTEKNVMDSDGTLILTAGKPTGGIALTLEFVIRNAKPYLIIDLDQEKNISILIGWAETHKIHVLNVTGPRESIFPGIYRRAADFLRGMLTNKSLFLPVIPKIESLKQSHSIPDQLNAYAEEGHYINRAIRLYEEGNYEEAIEDCNFEIAKNAKDNLPYFYRGLCFLSLGEYDHGLMEMKKAARLGNLVAQERLIKVGETW